jgi:hypothetical protein
MNNLINELKKQISFYLSNTDTTITFANNYSINIKKDGLLGILEELFYKFVDADTEADNNKLQENADLYNFYFKKKLELLEYPQPIQSTNLYLFMNKTIMDYYLLISPIFRYNKRLVIIKELYKCDPCLLRNYHLNTAGMRTASQKEETLIIF